VLVTQGVGLVITAHRDLADGDDLVIRKAMKEFIGYGEFDYIMFGGARGGDTFALAAALDLRNTSPKPLKLVVVVPDTLAAQPRETWATTERADRIIELRHRITHEDGYWALHHRNEFMVDWAYPEGRLLAFWNGEKSGTANAVFYARRMGMEDSVRTIKSISREKKAPWTPIRT
jgi:uncharacterized phage-like protein YoqJ